MKDKPIEHMTGPWINFALVAAAQELYDAARELIAWHERNPAAVNLQRIVETFERLVDRIEAP